MYLIFENIAQSAALVAVTNVAEYLDETSIRKMIIPKTKLVYEKNNGDIKIVLNVLSCVERTLDKLDRPMIIDEVLPLLWDVRLSDPEVILRVVSKCCPLKALLEPFYVGTLNVLCVSCRYLQTDVKR